MNSLKDLIFTPPPLTDEQIQAAKEWEAEEDERKREAQEKHYLQCGIPPRFLTAEADADLVQKVFGGRGLYVQGEVGTGKSRLAAAIAREVINSGKSARFMASVEALSRIRSTYGGEGTEEEEFKRLCSCHLLVLDDLGKEKISDWTLQTLFRIVNDRYNSMRPIVVTTQFPSTKLSARLASSGDTETAQAIISRLYGMCDHYKMEGKDRRLS